MFPTTAIITASRQFISIAARRGAASAPSSSSLRALSSLSSSSSSLPAWFNENTAPIINSRSFSSSHRPSPVKTTFNLPDPSSNKHYGDNLCSHNQHHHQLTKIVATIGPTSEQYEPLRRVVEAGMKIMRLNFSHATKEEVELRVGNLKKIQEAELANSKNCGDLQEIRAILLDTKGPEIRSGKLKNDDSGHETIKLVAGSAITLTNSDNVKDYGSDNGELYIDYPALKGALNEPGMKVLLDDGAIILTVTGHEGNDVVCTIDNTGELRSRAGVNLPDSDTSGVLPAMSEKDKADIRYGMTNDVDIDFVAASFVQSAAGVNEIRSYIEQCGIELGYQAIDKPLPLIVSKIETATSLKNFDSILEASDAIMVARGDLGVEIPLSQITNAQKEMIAACNAVGKPAIVATQMLESMSKNPRPTRAEVADVTNAVYDGADCVMLSGESAKGKYPSESVQFMNDIILSAETYQASGAIGHPENHQFLGLQNASCNKDDRSSAIARAAVTASHERNNRDYHNPEHNNNKNCSAILVLTHHGGMPKLIAAYRPHVPIYAFCPHPKIGRQLQLYRGVHPIVFGNGNGIDDPSPAEAIEMAKNLGYLQSGNEVVMVSMEDDDNSGERAGTMKLVTVP